MLNYEFFAHYHRFRLVLSAEPIQHSAFSIQNSKLFIYMKSVFIAYDQAYQEKILFTLDHLNCRGFSMFPQVQGRGSKTGEPHYGSHAWPSMCSAVLTVVRDEQVDPLLAELHRIDKETERLGLRAFVWDVEKSI